MKNLSLALFLGIATLIPASKLNAGGNGLNKLAITASLGALSVASVKLYQEGYLNFISRLWYKKQYEDIDAIRKKLEDKSEYKYAFWRIKADSVEFFSCPESVLKRPNDLRMFLAYDKDNVILKKEDVQGHDFKGKHLQGTYLKSLNKSI